MTLVCERFLNDIQSYNADPNDLGQILSSRWESDHVRQSLCSRDLRNHESFG